MPNYTYATLAQAQSDLAARLFDPNMNQWTAAELTLYIQESLRTWNAYTSFWRNQFSFSLSQGDSWYDIPSQSGSLRPYTITDNYLTQLIEYHLLEPQTATYPLVWTGSNQFTVTQILDALTDRQNEVLSTAACTITRQTPTASTSARATVLADTAMDIRRVVWIPGSPTKANPVTILRQADVWEKQAFDQGYLQASAAPPQTWFQSTQPPPTFNVDRTPPIAGTYGVNYIKSGNVFNTTGSQLLSMPDDWTWVAKWGALGDLFATESNAKDPARAAYCERRFQEGMRMLGNAASVLSLLLNGVPLFVDGVTNADDYAFGWEGYAQGAPGLCCTTGLNLLGFPPPDNGSYSVTLTVVQNAPVPSVSTDDIQLSRADYDTMIDYAQHLAMFKTGGQEFLATVPLYQAFLDRAAVYNDKLAVMGMFQWAQWDISQTDNQRNPLMMRRPNG